MSNIVLALSGGLDSTVLLYSARKQGHKVRCVSFDYGSKHKLYELIAIERIADELNIQNVIARVDLSVLFSVFRSSLLKSKYFQQREIPEAHYNDPAQKATIVPGRNLIFASILAGIAQSNYESSEVWLGMHTGDFAIYPDCTPTWVENLYRVIDTQSEGKVVLRAPWIDENIDKVDIVRRGLELGVPFELTRTCYKDQEVACGLCGACIERLEAFAMNETDDPLEYQDKRYAQKFEG
jgi:7-cyano-7-deazaguanine synthase